MYNYSFKLRVLLSLQQFCINNIIQQCIIVSKLLMLCLYKPTTPTSSADYSNPYVIAWFVPLNGATFLLLSLAWMEMLVRLLHSQGFNKHCASKLQTATGEINKFMSKISAFLRLARTLLLLCMHFSQRAIKIFFEESIFREGKQIRRNFSSDSTSGVGGSEACVRARFVISRQDVCLAVFVDSHHQSIYFVLLCEEQNHSAHNHCCH